MIGAVIAHHDSSVRRQFYNILEDSNRIEILQAVSDPTKLFEAVEEDDPDVLLIGLQFDRLSGLDLLDHIMRTDPTPTLMIGDESRRNKEEAVKAFSYGAVDFISPHQREEEILQLIKMAAGSRVKRLIREEKPEIESPDFSDKILVIGSSTGGPPEIERILKSLGDDFPAPIVVAQHMGEEFTSLFADRIDKLSDLKIREVSNEHELKEGEAWIGPGGKDVEIKKSDGKFFVETRTPTKGNTPSVDRLMKSASKVYGKNTLAVILSGMGDDGAIGASYVKSRGGKVLVQDKETSKVYGMPRHVKEQGHADEKLPIDRIPQSIARCI